MKNTKDLTNLTVHFALQMPHISNHAMLLVVCRVAKMIFHLQTRPAVLIQLNHKEILVTNVLLNRYVKTICLIQQISFVIYM
jgi:hypothetical protein